MQTTKPNPAERFQSRSPFKLSLLVHSKVRLNQPCLNRHVFLSFGPETRRCLGWPRSRARLENEEAVCNLRQLVCLQWVSEVGSIIARCQVYTSPGLEFLYLS